MSVPLRSESIVEPVRVLPMQGATAALHGLSQPRPHRSGSKGTGAKRPAVTVVQALPKAKRPLWLKGLMGLQAVSSGLALGTVGVTLVMYGLTVQADRRLNAATTTLRQLQQQEQQLTSAKAVLQHHLNQDAVDNQAESPEQNVIFLDPEIAPAADTTDPPADTASSQPFFSISTPMGY